MLFKYHRKHAQVSTYWYYILTFKKCIQSRSVTLTLAYGPSSVLLCFQLLNGGMKDAVVKPSPMPVQPAVPNAPTENDLIASKCSLLSYFSSTK